MKITEAKQTFDGEITQCRAVFILRNRVSSYQEPDQCVEYMKVWTLDSNSVPWILRHTVYFTALRTVQKYLSLSSSHCFDQGLMWRYRCSRDAVGPSKRCLCEKVVEYLYYYSLGHSCLENSSTVESRAHWTFDRSSSSYNRLLSQPSRKNNRWSKCGISDFLFHIRNSLIVFNGLNC